MSNAPLPNGIAGTVHWKYYGESDKVNAPENLNREFQEGYCTGIGGFGYNATQTIEAEYFLRLDVKRQYRRRLRGMEARLLGSTQSTDPDPWEKEG